MSGLPGISVPATEKAWLFRSGCDLFVLHSGREVEEFSGDRRELGGGGAVGLATAAVPRPVRRSRAGDRATGWCSRPRPRCPSAGRSASGSCSRWPRWPSGGRTWTWWSSSAPWTPSARPTTSATTTSACGRHGRRRPGACRRGAIRGGSHARAPGPRGRDSSRSARPPRWRRSPQSVPLLVLSDFGVSAEMINLVFEGSGLLGTLDELAGARSGPRTRPGAGQLLPHPAATTLGLPMVALVGQARSGRLVPGSSLLDGLEFAAARRRARLRVEVPPEHAARRLPGQAPHAPLPEIPHLTARPFVRRFCTAARPALLTVAGVRGHMVL